MPQRRLCHLFVHLCDAHFLVENLCESLLGQNEAINGVSRDGGHAEYVTLRTEAVAAVPKEMDPYEGAPQLCAGVTTYNSLRHMNVLPGQIVAVQGLGGLGHLAVQFSRQMGYRTVALSSSSAKKDFATELGAHDYVDGSKENQAEALQKMGGAKVIMCTAPSAEIIPGLLNGLGKSSAYARFNVR